MAYVAMKKLIMNANNRLNEGVDTAEAYLLWKKSTKNKLDVFFACDRITLSQYEELTRMLLDIEQTNSTTEAE